jgi:hypothetical protein
MPIEHTVEQGDCLANVAQQYGFADWRTIYDHDLNGDLRNARPDPNVLLPGDRLVIPDKRDRTETGQTAMVHTYRVMRKETRLRVVVRDIDGSLLSGKRYRLKVEDAVYEGTLGEDALLDQIIPADALDGELTVWADDDIADYQDTWMLKLGHMDPVEALTGIQARLNNLGYDCGPVDGLDGPRTQAAVRAFQKAQKLEVDGLGGPRTQAALKKEHGS